MGKRVAIISSIVLIAALATLGYFLQQGRQTLFTDPYRSISPEACMIIETVDLQSFLNSLTTGKGLFGETGKVRELDKLNSKLRYITDQANNAVIKKIIAEGSAIISFYPSPNGKLRTLLSMTLQGKVNYRHIKETLNSAGIRVVIESRIDGQPVFKLPYLLNNTRDTAYISAVSGLMLISNSSGLIRDAGVQISRGKDIRSLPGFSRVLGASGKNQDKIFIVFANLPYLLKPVLADAAEVLSDKIVKLAGTAEGDIYISDDGIVLSGYTESVDSSEILYKFKDIQPKEFHTYKILPTSTVLFETIIIPERKLTGKAGNEVSQQAFDLAGKLGDFTGEEATRAIINIRGQSVDDNTLLIYSLKNRVQAEQSFQEELGNDSRISYFEPDEQTKIPVYQTPFRGFNKILVPGFAPGINDSCFAFCDDYLITGSSFSTISRLLYENLLNKTLANDVTYRDFENSLPSRANYFFYCVPSHITDLLTGYLNDKIINTLRANRSSLNKIQTAGYQFASSNGMIYNSLSVRYKEEAREESTTEWETLLDTTACIKPFFFTNHITGAKEIFIQDIKNNTYLINAAGRVLWKVPLNERILGDIYMIDYFHNGKYQLLFSSKNYIHILDRNGNYVERYPVRLRSPATNPVTLFDYDNNLNYRLLIAGEDKQIYSYDITGNVIKGWKPFRTAGNVVTTINYFKVSGKDYIVASDEVSVYLLDRTGNKRINLKEPVIKATGSSMRLISGPEPYLVCTSPDGTIQQIYFDGSVKKISLKKFSADHSFDIFDVDGDGIPEYIFIDKGKLYLYNNDRKERFSREFGSAELGGPINFIFSSADRKIGVFAIDKKLIYLIDKNGGIMKGFPLKGASMFSIGKLSDDSGWHLIVGGTDRFLYNYNLDEDLK